MMTRDTRQRPIKFNEAVQRIRAAGTATQYVANWRDYVPKGSKWDPGSPGKPDCTVCKGLGYLRQDLPVGHPLFGKLWLCDCVPDNQP